MHYTIIIAILSLLNLICIIVSLRNIRQAELRRAQSTTEDVTSPLDFSCSTEDAPLESQNLDICVSA